MGTVDWIGLLDVLSRAVAALVVGTGALGLLFHKALLEWFKSRFSRAVGRELESHKHELARDLEAYKAAALRDLEQFKLGIDIRRSIALKMAGSRLDALTALASKLNHFTNEATSMATMNVQQRTANGREYLEALDEARKGARSAEIFLSLDANRDITVLIATGHNVAQLGGQNSMAENDPRILAVMTAYAGIANALRDEIYAEPSGLPQ